MSICRQMLYGTRVHNPTIRTSFGQKKSSNTNHIDLFYFLGIIVQHAYELSIVFFCECMSLRRWCRTYVMTGTSSINLSCYYICRLGEPSSITRIVVTTTIWPKTGSSITLFLLFLLISRVTYQFKIVLLSMTWEVIIVTLSTFIVGTSLFVTITLIHLYVKWFWPIMRSNHIWWILDLTFYKHNIILIDSWSHTL